MNQNQLRIVDLKKTYPNGVEALKGVSFEVQRGEFLAIIGLSGSGKSTLLRCLNRLQKPTCGDVFFHDENIARIEGPRVREVRRQMGMIFQQFHLVSRFTVLKNVLLGRLAGRNLLGSLFLPFGKDDQKLAMKYLEMVGIADKAYHRADALSGGQQQRVAIARALAQGPEILLADEPVASLDPATCHTVLDHLRKINQELGMTIICNLHFLSLVRQYATRVIALNAGKIVFEGPSSEIDDAWFKRIYGEGTKEIYVR